MQPLTNEQLLPVGNEVLLDQPKPPEAVLRPKCYCGADSGRARRRAQGDIPCDGTWCAARRAAAEEQQQPLKEPVTRVLDYLIEGSRWPRSHAALYG